MIRHLPWLIAAVAAYEAFACKTGRWPTITQLVHGARVHFRPTCPHCTVRPLVPRGTNQRPAWPARTR